MLRSALWFLVILMDLLIVCPHIILQVTIYRKLLIGRDGNLDQSEVRYIVTCTRIRVLVINTTSRLHCSIIYLDRFMKYCVIIPMHTHWHVIMIMVWCIFIIRSCSDIHLVTIYFMAEVDFIAQRNPFSFLCNIIFIFQGNYFVVLFLYYLFPYLFLEQFWENVIILLSFYFDLT